MRHNWRQGLGMLQQYIRTSKSIPAFFQALCGEQCIPCRLTSCRGYMTKAETAFEGRTYVPRRAVMYVPAHDMKKLQKIPRLGVDCAVMECEDGVALNRKGEARENIRTALGELDFSGLDCAVRVNSVSSGHLEEDLQVIFSASKLPATILLPKVDTVDELNYFTEKLQSVVKGRPDGYCPYLVTYAESAAGILSLKEILQQAQNFSDKNVYTIDGVVFGSDDYCADIGATRTTDAEELIYARQKVVMIAKAFRLQAIDMVHIDIKDSAGLQRQCEAGARLGYTGKQVIHPSQVPIVQAAFTPSPQRIQWATELVAGFQEHQKSGRGAFTFHGSMIDMPLLLQAKNIIKIAEVTKKS